MRFMILRKADKDTEAYVMPTERLLGEMGKYMEEMANAGVLLAGEGLHPSLKGDPRQVLPGQADRDRRTLRRDPGLIAGYATIEVASREEAVEWARRWPALDGDGDVELKIRQIFEAEDFGAEFTSEMRDAEERLRAQLAEKQKG